MNDKIIAGALAYREKRGTVEWFLAKIGPNGGLEIPKSDVRRGESSVSAAIRYLKETAGLRALVQEEAGRISVTTKSGGQPVDAKVYVYLMKQGSGNGRSEFPQTLEGQWLKFPLARKKLDLAREQKVLSQANSILRQWQKAKKNKK